MQIYIHDEQINKLSNLGRPTHRHYGPTAPPKPRTGFRNPAPHCSCDCICMVFCYGCLRAFECSSAMYLCYAWSGGNVSSQSVSKSEKRWRFACILQMFIATNVRWGMLNIPLYACMCVYVCACVGVCMCVCVSPSLGSTRLFRRLSLIDPFPPRPRNDRTSGYRQPFPIMPRW